MNIYLSTNANNSSPELFKCLRKYTNEIESASDTSTCLDGTIVKHIKYYHRKHNITIGADVLSNNSKLNYLNSFLVSPIKKLSFDGTNYVNVIINSETLNLSYVDNLDFLREATITFIETNAGGN